MIKKNARVAVAQITSEQVLKKTCKPKMVKTGEKCVALLLRSRLIQS